MSSLPTDDDPVLQLIENIKAGKDVERSFADLHKKFFRPVLSFFQRRGFTSEEAHDLTQETFLRVFHGMEGFRGDSRFERWLFEIAGNIYRNEIRRRRTEKRNAVELPLEAGLDRDNPSGQKTFDPVDPDPGALAAIEERERLESLRAAVQELPAQMRHVCELRFLQGRKYREIAVQLKISIETVKAHLHQARKRLIAKFGDDFLKKAGITEEQGSES